MSVKTAYYLLIISVLYMLGFSVLQMVGNIGLYYLSACDPDNPPMYMDPGFDCQLFEENWGFLITDRPYRMIWYLQSVILSSIPLIALEPIRKHQRAIDDLRIIPETLPTRISLSKRDKQPKVGDESVSRSTGPG